MIWTESEIGRRTLLAAAGALALATLTPKAFAAPPTDRRFVLVVLRGGLDGLHAVVPYGDRDYQELRGPIAVPAPGNPWGALPLADGLGLHPALAPLLQGWARGELAVLPAVGHAYRERSHFDAQNVLETGADRPHARGDGWLNRALALYGPGAARLAVADQPSLPLVLQGAVPIGTSAGAADRPESTLDRLARIYASDPMLAAALDDARRSEARAREVQSRAGGGSGAQRVGRLLAQADGPRLAVLESNGWDTHAQQGAGQGMLAQRLGALADELETLRTEIGPAWRQTVVAVATEFGRTARVNGTGGTDHGTGACGFLYGGAVAGGRLLGPWPGLDVRRLHQGRDLAQTLDWRAVLKGLLADHLGLPARDVERAVFPGSAGLRPLSGLVRA